MNRTACANAVNGHAFRILALAALYGCNREAPIEKPSGASAGPTRDSGIAFSAGQVAHGRIRWGQPGEGAAAATSGIPARVAPNEDRTSRLGAPARGRILAVAVAPGDRVRRGQVLVTMQSPDAGMAQSDLAKATSATIAQRAQASYASSALARAQRLLDLKAIPRQDYERAVADNEMARAGLAQAEAELRRARATATALGAGASANGEIALRSPLNGVVLERTAIAGTVVEAGTPLVVVTDPATLWLAINAPEAVSGSVVRGGTLQFLVPAYPSDTFTARVSAVGAGLDPATRTLPVRGVAANPGGRLKPEMLATVVVQDAASASALFLPEDAVQTVDGVPSVFIAEPDGKGGAHFTIRKVVVAGRSGGRVVIAAGVTRGEMVVLEGAFAIKAELQKGSMPQMEM